MDQITCYSLSKIVTSWDIPGLQEAAEKEAKEIAELEYQLQVYETIMANAGSDGSSTFPILPALSKMVNDAFNRTVKIKDQLKQHKNNYTKVMEIIEDMKSDQEEAENETEAEIETENNSDSTTEK